MRRTLQSLVALSLVVFFFLPTRAQSFRDELNLGIAAYKSSRYEEAIQHFRRATELDPGQTVAHMYMATTYASQYIPGVESDENSNFAYQAIEQYQFVLNSDELTSKVNGIKGIAYLYLNMKKFDEAKDYYQRATSFDPKDPEPYYSIGVIDWTQCYKPRMDARSELKLRPEDHLDGRNPEQKRACEQLRSSNSGLIEDGIANINKAIELRPDYDDAMAYMNLLYRERADLECDDAGARERDLRTADKWVDKTLAIKKAKVERQQARPTAPNPQ